MSKHHLLTQTWYDALGHLARQVGSDQFHPCLIAVLKQIAPFDHAVIIAYPAGNRPVHLFNDLPEKQLGPSLEVYLNGAYLLDPFYLACQQGMAEGYYRLRALAPDEFYTSEYYRSYYKATYLQDEVGILVAVDDRTRVIVSLGIREGEKSVSNVNSLALVLPLLNALCLQHWRGMAQLDATAIRDGGDEGRLRETLDLAFKNFGRDFLSERECEIVRLVLKGHSSRSISDLLNISAETVKAHRKHVHSKLRISSQAELFSLFLESISGVESGFLGDPLSTHFSRTNP